MLHSHTHCQAPRANAQAKACQRVCIMPNHVHMIIQAVRTSTKSKILRDVKKFTSRAITNKLEIEKPEGYHNVLSKFAEAGKSLKRITTYTVNYGKTVISLN